MKRVLAGIIGDGKAGGVDRYLLNYWEAVSGDDVQIDFLTNVIDGSLKQKLGERGSRLFGVATLKHPVRQYRQVREILRQGHYDAVYFNISTAIECIAVIAAKKEGIKKRMLHSHSGGNNCENGLERMVYDFLHHVCRLFLYRYATHYYGCSEKAGEWLFPKRIVRSGKFQIVYNAVERDRFAYDEKVRQEVRKELDVEGKLVVGNIAAFCYQKNHMFLLAIFAEVLKKKEDAVLLLAGEGPCFGEVKKKARELHIEKNVQFLGRREDADRLYQAMDVFLLPSRFEGLPIVGVEAQSAGLPCILSDRITKEAAITKRCKFLSLKEGARLWADAVIQVQKKGPRRSAEFLPVAVYYDLDRQKEQLKTLV